jgi:hypothetical protein
MKELWKEIPQYPHCEVSNYGRVRYKDEFFRSCHRLTKQLRPLKLGGFGYLQVNIVSPNSQSYGTTESVHNLVAETFIGPKPKDGHHVDHIDNNKLNNNPSNLRWISHGHNTIRSQNTGMRRFFYEGELWLMKKLIFAKVPYKIIGRMFRCSTMLVSDVRKGFKDYHIKNYDGTILWKGEQL